MEDVEPEVAKRYVKILESSECQKEIHVLCADLMRKYIFDPINAGPDDEKIDTGEVYARILGLNSSLMIEIGCLQGFLDKWLEGALKKKGIPAIPDEALLSAYHDGYANGVLIVKRPNDDFWRDVL